jgi:hypothetical protein
MGWLRNNGLNKFDEAKVVCSFCSTSAEEMLAGLATAVCQSVSRRGTTTIGLTKDALEDCCILSRHVMGMRRLHHRDEELARWLLPGACVEISLAHRHSAFGLPVDLPPGEGDPEAPRSPVPASCPCQAYRATSIIELVAIKAWKSSKRTTGARNVYRNGCAPAHASWRMTIVPSAVMRAGLCYDLRRVHLTESVDTTTES